MEMLSYPWWAVGKPEETILALPDIVGVPGLGCFYAVGLESGAYKIGSTSAPRKRIRDLVGVFKNYAINPVASVAVSFPTPDYADIEKSIHSKLSETRLSGELFSASWDAIQGASMAAFCGSSVHPRPIDGINGKLKRGGRQPKPWIRSGYNYAWYVTVGGRKTFLGRDKEKAYEEYRKIMDAQGIHTDFKLEDMAPPPKLPLIPNRIPVQ
jgi:T5orf172 domain